MAGCYEGLEMGYKGEGKRAIIARNPLPPSPLPDLSLLREMEMSFRKQNMCQTIFD
jgi:hypothetical protein